MEQNTKHRRRVFICSPYRAVSKDPIRREAEMDENIDRVHNACRMASALGLLPLAPHGYFTNFLNDRNPQEREEGMELGMEWLAQSDEVWVVGTRVSEGMSREIAKATELGIPVRNVPEPSRMLADFIRGVKAGIAYKVSKEHKGE